MQWVMVFLDLLPLLRLQQRNVCRVCLVDKPLSEFHYRSDSGKHRTECKSCRCKREAASRYNLAVSDVETMKAKQHNCCAICGTHAEDIVHKTFSETLVIDHCHSTGKVRGLLCPTCNSMLGHAKDDLAILKKAIDYLLQ